MMREYTVFNDDQCDGLQDNVTRGQAGTTIVVAATLRHALKDLVFETTHSETLALIAKAFGCDNWNILSAKIEAAERANNLSTLVPVDALEPTAPQLLRCSFCNKSQHDVRELIVGPPVYICDECVEACLDVIRWEGKAFRLLKPDEESGN